MGCQKAPLRGKFRVIQIFSRNKKKKKRNLKQPDPQCKRIRVCRRGGKEEETRHKVSRIKEILNIKEETNRK